MAAIGNIFFVVSLLILLSTTHSDKKQCDCEKGNWLLCGTCSPGCRRSSINKCVPCPDHCVDCTNSTHCSVCEPGHWGTICEKNCYSEQCKGNTCSKDTGLCKGCIEGYFGTKGCKKCPRTCLTCFSQEYCDKCQHGYSGRDCRFRCDNCIDGQCYKARCTKGCMNGYFSSRRTFIKSNANIPLCLRCPDSCNTCISFSECMTCNAGFYGRGCQYKCNECKNGLCNKDGCIEGCAEGYFKEPQTNAESYCTICPKNCASCVSKNRCHSCKKGFYGHTCNSTCDLNCLHDECNMTDGVCVHGCRLGFYQANNGCIDCPECNKNGSCIEDNCQASCCQVNTSSPTCTVDNCQECSASQSNNCELCKNGFFRTNGDECNKCSKGCRSGNCDDISGRCVDGCYDGWTGDRCEVTCSNGSCSTGVPKQSSEQSQETPIIVGSVIGGVAFLLMLVIGVIIKATLRRRSSRLPSPSHLVTNTAQDSNDQTTPQVITYENNLTNSALVTGDTTDNNSDMMSQTYEEISCYVEGTQQYEDLGVRDEHIYLHGVDEDQDYVN